MVPTMLRSLPSLMRFCSMPQCRNCYNMAYMSAFDYGKQSAAAAAQTNIHRLLDQLLGLPRFKVRRSSSPLLACTFLYCSSLLNCCVSATSALTVFGLSIGADAWRARLCRGVDAPYPAVGGVGDAGERGACLQVEQHLHSAVCRLGSAGHLHACPMPAT